MAWTNTNSKFNRIGTSTVLIVLTHVISNLFVGKAFNIDYGNIDFEKAKFE
jgi:hypothetical protein